MQTPEEFLESNGLATTTLDRAALIAAFQKENGYNGPQKKAKK